VLHVHQFSVEPLPSHPKFWEVEAGWATVTLRAADDSEQTARDYLAKHHMKPTKLLWSREVPPEQYPLLPRGTLESLQRFPIHCYIAAYEVGGASQSPGKSL
jgi:hypothetical protein